MGRFRFEEPTVAVPFIILDSAVQFPARLHVTDCAGTAAAKTSKINIHNI